MPIIENVEFWYPRLAADRPEQYQNKGARRWKVQIRTTEKAQADLWKKEYGLKVAPEEIDGRIVYKATISARAFDAVEGSEGAVDDLEKPRKPVTVMLANGEELDPYTIGNGSSGDLSFYHKRQDDGEHTRVLKAVSVRRLLKRKVQEEDNFKLTDDVEIIEEDEEDNSLF